MSFAKNFIRRDECVTAIEYALIASLICVVIVAAVGLLGNKVAGLFTTVNTSLS